MHTSLTAPEREQGFTLIELLVVIIIIGILAAIAIPLFLDQRKLAVDASVKSDVRNTLANIKTWQANDANANTVIANTGDFTSATNGGKVAQSPGNSIGVQISSTGDISVCGYNAGGKTYTADTASGSVGAYVFSASTGQFTTGSCATGSTTGGVAATGSGSGGASAQPVTVFSRDFEDGTTQGCGAGTVNTTVTNATVAGRKAARLSGSLSGNSVYANCSGVNSLTLTAGKSYTWSGYIYVNNYSSSKTNQTFAAYLKLYGANTKVTPSVTTTGSWQPVSITFTAANTGTIDYYALRVDGVYEDGMTATTTAYMDDVSLVQNN